MQKLISQSLKKYLRIVLPIVVLTGFSFAVNAQSKPAPTKPPQIDDQIAAQISITNDDIKQLLKKMEEKSQTNDGLSHADYILKAQGEHQKAQAALDEFEAYLQNTLFVEIHSMLVNYNNIYISNAYTPEQKSQLLNNTSTVLNGFFIAASQRYRNELYKLYSALGSGFDAIVHKYQTICAKGGCDPSVNYGLNRAGYYVTRSDYYSSTVLPMILSQCYSRSCISYSATDEILFYTMVRNLFGAPITFTALDGTSYQLNHAEALADHAQVAEMFLSFMSDESLFPQEVQALPFDINSAGLASAVAKTAPKSEETCKPHWGHKCPK